MNVRIRIQEGEEKYTKREQEENKSRFSSHLITSHLMCSSNKNTDVTYKKEREKERRSVM